MTSAQDPNATDEQQLRKHFEKSADVTIRSHGYGPPSSPRNVLLLYVEGMVKTELIDETVLPQLYAVLNEAPSEMGRDDMIRSLKMQLQTLPDRQGLETVAKRLFSGELILYVDHPRCLMSLNIAKLPNRTPEESNSEVSVKGPRDSFTENLVMNMALVRKRLKDTSLCYEKFEIGERSHTSVTLAYLDDVARPEIVEEARRRLTDLKVDGLVSSGQLEEGLSGYSRALFPVLDYTGRPDFVVDALLRGRFAVLVDGSPMAIIAPSNLLLTMKSPEDASFPYYFVTFERLLRFIGLFIALFLPGFWVAVSSFNLDQIPFPLLATIASSRLGVPFSATMDFYIMLGLFELFREAGLRLPKAVGQTVAVLGGLIVGDAAIRAGITSPMTLVVAAVSTISMFSLVNQSLAGAITILRLIILVVSSFLGMYGFMLSVLGLMLYLASLETFGVPYCAPLSPLHFKELIAAMLAKPWGKQRRRPALLKPEDDTRQDGGTSNG